MQDIEVGRVYRTATGKRVRVTEFHDWASVVFYVVLDSENRFKDFGNATVDQFIEMTKSQQHDSPAPKNKRR